MSKDQKKTKKQNVETVDKVIFESYDLDDKECIDCKYYVPGNTFHSKCLNCDNGSNFIKK